MPPSNSSEPSSGVPARHRRRQDPPQALVQVTVTDDTVTDDTVTDDTVTDDTVTDPQRDSTQIRAEPTSGFARALTIQATFELPEPELPSPRARWKAQQEARRVP